MSRSEPNLKFELPPVVNVSNVHAWTLWAVPLTLVGLLAGVFTALLYLGEIGPFDPAIATAQRAAETAGPCPTPAPGERVEIVIRNQGGQILASCRRLPLGAITR